MKCRLWFSNVAFLLRVKDINNDLEKEQGTLNAELSKLKLSESNNEENDALRKSNQELEDKLNETSEELSATQDKLQAHDQAAKRAIAALQKEMALRVDQVSKLLWLGNLYFIPLAMVAPRKSLAVTWFGGLNLVRIPLKFCDLLNSKQVGKVTVFMEFLVVTC